TNDKPSTFLLRKTSCRSSCRTLVNGGYIITISPTAIGIEVVPTLNLSRKGTTPGTSQPRTTPIAIAQKIHAVRYRSRKPRRLLVFVDNPQTREGFPQPSFVTGAWFGQSDRVHASGPKYRGL